MKEKLHKTIKAVILKRYILIFTLALISCVGTKYIQALSTHDLLEKNHQESGLECKKTSKNDLAKVKSGGLKEEKFQLI